MSSLTSPRYNLQNIELEPVEIHLDDDAGTACRRAVRSPAGKVASCEVDVEENLEVYGDPGQACKSIR